MAAYEAYKYAYKVKPTTKPASIRVCANRVMKNPELQARIADLRQDFGDNTPLTTRDEQLKNMLRVQGIAMENLQDEFEKGAADIVVKTAEAICKMCGYNEPEKVDSKVIIEFVDFDEELAR